MQWDLEGNMQCYPPCLALNTSGCGCEPGYENRYSCTGSRASLCSAPGFTRALPPIPLASQVPFTLVFTGDDHV